MRNKDLYKFSEVVSLLTNYPELKFESDSSVVGIENGYIVFRPIGEEGSWSQIDTNDMNKIYTMQTHEVHYTVALRAFVEEGKSIKIIKANGSTYIIKPTETSFEFNIDDMKNGKWYILG